VDALIAGWTSRILRDDAVAALRAEGLMAGPVLDDADALADPHLAVRGYFLEVEHEDAGSHRYPGMPYRFRDAALSVRLPPVRLGEHNERIYRDLLGYSDEEIARLEERGHIGTAYAPHIK
jgi:crotonobetainyl-CoA:carnitine CoA-transferase CaiB-like acyl-CoA transferase